MKAKLLIILFFAVAILVTYALQNPESLMGATVFKRGTVVGNVNLSGKRLNEGYSYLNGLISKPIYINTNNTSRAITLNEIGVSIDPNKLTKLSMTCPVSAIKIFCRKTSVENIDPSEIIAIDQNKVDEFLNELEDSVQYLAKNTIISFNDYTFKALTPDSRITIDRSNFESKENILDLIDDDRISIKLNPQPIDNPEDQHIYTEQLIQNMSYPLLIKYGRNPIYIPGDIVNSFLETTEKDGYLYGVIIDGPINEYLDTLDEQYKSDDVIVNRDPAVDSIKRALLYRSTNYEINNAVVLPIEGKSKTNGELHDTYLEVIKSQQRLYKFENGQLTKTYIVSTGLTWETPPGEYAVLGKTKMTISYVGDWYMPNYLPIGTINGYRFGFHAIPYHLDGQGNIYSRDPNTMGSPATGGCIQLTPEESLELFEWAEVGTPVYIYE